MKNLVIVESPAKSKTIEKYLGKDYTVLASYGHIRDLATSGKGGLGIDIENNFTPKYIVKKDSKKVVETLAEKASKAKNIYLATDPDREGEAISWHLSEVLNNSSANKQRVVFHEITKPAVLEAFENPRDIDMDLVKSQETRRMIDRIIGFDLSSLLKSKIKSKSAGRVQSVALKLIVDREKEIEAFNSEEYWTIESLFNKDDIEFSANLTKINDKKAEIHNKEEADKILSELTSEYVVKNIKEQTKKRNSKPAFITSTLQQEASTKLGFNAKKTMSIAQSLYEGIELENGLEGLITYMRTDSTRLSSIFVNSCKDYITDNYGKEYLGFYKVKNDDNSQDAHEGIRPTSIENTPEKIKKYLTNDQYKLYKFIYYRALASLMAPIVTDNVSLNLVNGNYVFNANGSKLKFDGFLKVYSDYDSSKDSLLPNLVEDDVLNSIDVKGTQHFTEPPLRYSEARLIKELEELGIGRPSTYATIIETIKTRGYTTFETKDNKKSKLFVPTEQGKLTTAKLEEFFSSIINVKYTADLEKELDDIALGKLEYLIALNDFYNKFIPLLDDAKKNMEKIQPEKTGEICPVCGSELVIRSGRFGKFVGCSNYPSCTYIKKEEKPKEEPVYVGKKCPVCNGELIQRKSRFNTIFVGCSNYPKCNYMETLDGEEIKPKKKAKKK